MQAGVGFHKPTTEAKLEKSKRFFAFLTFRAIVGTFLGLDFSGFLALFGRFVFFDFSDSAVRSGFWGLRF